MAPADARVDAAPPAPITWTVLVYGHGDHNLSPSLVRDIQEMARATLSENVRVVVLADFDASQGYPEGVSWLRVTSGNVAEVGVMPELNLDDPFILARAVEIAYTTFPSDRLGLILWNHGGAWIGGFGGDGQDGMLARPGNMTIGAMAGAIETGLAAAGASRLDLLVTDTCLLGGAEVLSEVADLADLYIGNGELDYGPGLDYTSVLTTLAQEPGISAAELARREATFYARHHAGNLVDRQLHAHAAVDLRAWRVAERELASFASQQTTSPRAFDLALAMLLSTPAYSNVDLGQLTMPGLRDLEQFLDWVAVFADDLLAAQARRAASALRASIVASSLGSTRTGVQGGINVELSPGAAERGEYSARAEAWNRATGWGGLLERIASHADSSGPEVLASAFSGNPVTMELGTFDDDAAAAAVFIATQDGVLYGLAGTGLIEPDYLYTFSWDGSVRAMVTSEGLEAVFARPWSLLYQPDGTARVPAFVVPGALIDGFEEIAALLLVDPSTGDAPLFVIPAGSRWATFTVAELGGAGLYFQPYVPFVDALGQLTYFGIGVVPVSGESLFVPIRQFNPGPFTLLLEMSDVWGNESYAAYDVTLGTAAKHSPGMPRDARSKPFEAIDRFVGHVLRGTAGPPALDRPSRPVVSGTGGARELVGTIQAVP